MATCRQALACSARAASMPLMPWAGDLPAARTSHTPAVALSRCRTSAQARTGRARPPGRGRPRTRCGSWCAGAHRRPRGDRGNQDNKVPRCCLNPCTTPAGAGEGSSVRIGPGSPHRTHLRQSPRAPAVQPARIAPLGPPLPAPPRTRPVALKTETGISAAQEKSLKRHSRLIASPFRGRATPLFGQTKGVSGPPRPEPPSGRKSRCKH